MKKNKVFKAIAATMLAAMMVSSSAVVFAESADTSTTVDDIVDIETKTIFDSWVNYPDASLGYGYNAGWTYNEEGDYMNTTENVGWTGFYNPEIDNLTTGKFSYDVKSLVGDPCGFTWGMVTGGTEEDPVYSFYVFEECHLATYNDTPYWSIAYISEWHPAADSNCHQGPLYHGTIDASDGYYDHEGKDADKIGFAEGEVLAYGTLDSSLRGIFHEVTIDIQEESVSVYINGELLTTVEAEVKAGSFGPFATSNQEAYFANLKMISTNDVMLNPVFEYRNAEDTAVNEAYQGDTITIADLSTFEGSEITEYNWTVTKDDEEIYTGSEPYANYTDEPGTYVTSLSIKNAYGISSGVYTNTLVVNKIPNVLTPKFSYMNGETAVTEATTEDTITISDECEFSNSPIAEHSWTVTKDGEEVYTGTEPYAEYTSAAGEYVTTLVITNEDGETSEPYTLALTVTEVEESVEESSEESIEESSEESIEESSEESVESSVTSEPESSVEVADTGDSSSATGFAIAAVISAMAMAFTAVFTSKKKRTQK